MHILLLKELLLLQIQVNAYEKKLALKNNAPFTSCISKVNNALIDNAEDLHIVMPVYNFL